MIAPRMLLKSCAMPPASVPTASIFWDWRSWPSRSRRSCSAAFLAPMSTIELRTNMPSSVSIGFKPISTGISVPSLRSPKSSRPAPIARLVGDEKKWARSVGCRGWKRAGTRASIFWPNSSSRAYPNIRSISRFTSTIRPSASTITMPLGEDSTAARNRSSARFRAPMSTIELRTNSPSSVTTGVSPISTGTSLPSLRNP